MSTRGPTLLYSEVDGSTVYFECVEEEDIVHGGDLTTHPIEQGAPVADNYQAALDECTLSVFVSQISLGRYDNTRVLTTQVLDRVQPRQSVQVWEGQAGDPVNQLHTLLEQYRLAATLFTVYTPSWYMGHMAIVDYPVHGDSSIGTSRTFKIHLQEVRQVQTQTVNAPTPSVPAKNQASKGAVESTTVPAPVGSSGAWALFNGGGG